MKTTNPYVPWRFVKFWNCTFCGFCCQVPIVHLTPTEESAILKRFGGSATMLKSIRGRQHVFLNKKREGCVFLHKLGDKWLCSIQRTKPILCKLWPFIVCDRAKYGNPARALFYFRRRRFFIYVTPHCKGLEWGKPSNELTQRILPEAINIRFGLT